MSCSNPFCVCKQCPGSRALTDEEREQRRQDAIQRVQKLTVPEPYSHVRPDDWFLYTTPDEEAPESEVIELITAFVRALKPKIVVETGTAEGHTAEAIGRALAKNGCGTLTTVEIDAEKVDRCRKRLAFLPVDVVHGAAQSLVVTEQIDLLFIDGNLEERANEYMHFEPQLCRGGIALLHDTLKFNPPQQQVASLPGAQVWLSTPRGFTILQKP